MTGSSTLGHCITSQFSGGAVVPVLNPFGLPGGVTPFSPQVQADLRARYDWQMKDFDWFVTGAVSYTGKMFSEPNTYPSGDNVSGVYGTTQYRYTQPAYTLADASLGFTKGDVTASVFVKNIFDSNASTFTSSPQFIQAQVPVRPRTFGVRIGVDF